MKKLFLFAMAAVALASCSESDELALSQAQQEAGRGEVAFSVYANRTTRAGKEGVMDMTNLQNANAGFGIFGYHTNNSLYDPQNSEPNFMYNQRVTWNTEENKWTYDPVKYWPNEFGENAVSNDIDYVSFFAYAPYVEFDPISGVALMPEMPETDEPLTPEQESQLKNQIQWKNITGASRNGDKGDPFIRYMVDVNPSTSVDLMWGVAADNSFQGLANPAVTSKEGECFINLSKQIGVNQTINWRFHHALAKLDVQIIAASDVATEGTTEYTPTDAIPVDEFTRVYLRWIEFSGFAMSGALSLNSKAPQAHWLNYDGATELKSTTIRFNDGLLNGKEGILDNVNPNEVVLGALNDTIIEKPTPLDEDGWMSVEKNAGIPTDKYVNVFAGATADKKSFFVIPTNAPLTINMLYDIETKDTQLNKYLSDGVTPGTRISNEITKELRDVKIEAGKAYTIKIVVGLESVKVTAEVEEWGESSESKIDMPYNPYAATTQAIVGGKTYDSFQEAVAAAQNGDVIKMTKDVSLGTDTWVLALGDKAITIDLDGNTLTGRTNLTSGTLTLKNGTISNPGGQPLNVYGSETEASNYSVMNIEEDVTVKGKYGVCLFGPVASAKTGYGTVINIKGTIEADGEGAIFVSGNLGNNENLPSDMNNIINIYGKVTTDEQNAAVALHGTATVNVENGANIIGGTGIAVKRGVLNMNGGTVLANGPKKMPPTTNFNGTEPTGAGISITDTYLGKWTEADGVTAQYGTIVVNLNGGSVTSTNAPALYQNISHFGDQVSVTGNGTTLTGVE